jgi:predicted nucleic acid-binding protein
MVRWACCGWWQKLGATVSVGEEYEAWLTGLLAECRVIEITEPTTKFYASLQNELREAGRPIPANDIWIAALCRQYKLPLLSKDHHFDSVRGIRRIEW